MPFTLFPGLTTFTTSKPLKGYPATGAGVTVTAAGTSGTGTWTEVIPASTVTVAFALAGVSISDASGNPEVVLVDVGTGAGGAETAVLTVSGGGSGVDSWDHWLVPVPVEVAANTRVAVRISNLNGTGRAFVVRVHYYERPL